MNDERSEERIRTEGCLVYGLVRMLEYYIIYK